MLLPLIIKRSTTTGAPSSLLFGEMGYSQASQTLFIGRSNGVPEAIGGRGFFAPLDSPTFTGIPTVPTATAGNTTTQIASTAFVQAAINAALQDKDIKESCKAAATGNISLSSPGSVMDGVTLTPFDRVFLPNQTNQAENGIYLWTAAGSALTRTSDANTSDKVTSGMIVTVEEGAVNADTAWYLSTNGPITLDTTNLVFIPFPGTGGLIAGSGLSRTLSTFNVVFDNTTIYVNGSNQLAIKSSAISGQVILSQGSGSAVFGALNLANSNSVTGILPIANGGLGRSTLISGLVKGFGGSYVAAVPDVDYIGPDSIIDGGTF